MFWALAAAISAGDSAKTQLKTKNMTTATIMATAAYFTTPVLLGGGRVDVIAIQIQQASQVLFDFGYAATLSAMLVTMISAVAMVILLFTHWRRNVRARGSS